MGLIFDKGRTLPSLSLFLLPTDRIFHFVLFALPTMSALLWETKLKTEEQSWGFG